jgi:hypothetical protein
MKNYFIMLRTWGFQEKKVVKPANQLKENPLYILIFRFLGWRQEDKRL